MPSKKTSPKKSASRKQKSNVETSEEPSQVSWAIAENMLAMPLMLNAMSITLNKQSEMLRDMNKMLIAVYEQTYGEKFPEPSVSKKEPAVGVGAVAAKNYFLNELHETRTTKSAVRRERRERRDRTRLEAEAEAERQKKVDEVLSDELEASEEETAEA